MLDKSHYYRGAALASLMDDERCQGVRKSGPLGYLINGQVFVYLKYSTKARSPWGFTFDLADIDRCFKMTTECKAVVLGLVCGDDGVCALTWNEANELLKSKAGRIAAGRKHDHSYSVRGTEGKLKRKVPVGRWSALVFESEQKTKDNVDNESSVGTTQDA